MKSLSTWDESFGAGTAAVHREATIQNGIYTLTLPDGEHRTFRIHTRKVSTRFAGGKRVISLLVGPDNENDYEMFGFVDDEGIRCWQRHAHLEKFTSVIWRLATGEVVPGYELLIAGRCLRCNRTLTTPTAVERGIGDDCWKKLNV